MFFNLFKSKKSKKTKKDEDSKPEEHTVLHRDVEEQEQKQESPNRSKAVAIPRQKQISRLSRYSSQTSSIGHLSVISGATHVSSMSASSSKSTKSTKSNWSYNIDRFKGSKNVDPKMKSTGHADLWAQAYAFGGR